VQWIFNTKEGKKFLEKLLKSEKMELYECKAIEVMIEFLYMHYRKVVMLYRLPIYIIQLAIFYTAILLNEASQKHINIRKDISSAILKVVLEEEKVDGNVDKWYNDLDLDNVHFDHESYILDGTSDWWYRLAKTIAYLNLFMTFYSVIMVVSQAKYSFKTYFKSIWAYFDIAYCVINGYISI
jgi:hypothetical protein